MRPYRVRIKFSSGHTLRFKCEEFSSKNNGTRFTWKDTKPTVVDIDIDSVVYVVGKRRLTWYFWKLIGDIQ